MPSRPKKPCRKHGCSELVESGYCDKHTRETNVRDERRGNSHQRGYTNLWRKARLAYLSRHPLCVDCLRKGIVNPGNEVDHITPHRGDRDLFWDMKNWQTLCKSCHSQKTARGE